MGRWIKALGAKKSQEAPGQALTKPPKAPRTTLLTVLAVPPSGAFEESKVSDEVAGEVAGGAVAEADTSLLSVLAVPAPGAFEKSGAPEPAPRACTTCLRRTRNHSCGEPVVAGLATRFCLVLCSSVEGGGASCPAWSGRPVIGGEVLTVGDGLEVCTSCSHWSPGRCRNHRVAGLAVNELAHGWQVLPQRCRGFRRAASPEGRPMHGHATATAPQADSGPAGGIQGGMAKVRAAGGDGEALFVNVVAFSESAQTALLALDDGDSVALAGTLTPKAGVDKEGQPRPALDMVVHACLSPYHVTRKRDAVAAKRTPLSPQPKQPRRQADNGFGHGDDKWLRGGEE